MSVSSCPSTDSSFFSSRPGKAHSMTPSPVTVTSVIIKRYPSSHSPPVPPSSSPVSLCPSSPAVSWDTAKKRKSLPDTPQSSDTSPRPQASKRKRTDSAKVPTSRRKPKRLLDTSPRTSGRPRNAPSPEPIYRNSRSRSTSLFQTPDAIAPPATRCWATTDDGAPGDGHTSSEMVVRGLLKTYKSYFTNPNDPNDKSFEIDGTEYPWAELEFPNSHASERYALLAPKDKDHYNPIMDLEKTLYTIVEEYLTKAQQSLFGPIPTDLLSESAPPSPPRSPYPSLSSSSRTTSPSVSSLSSLSSESSITSLDSDPPRRPSILRSLQRAINKQDGPAFKTLLNNANGILRSLKYPILPGSISAPNLMMGTPQQWSGSGIPKNVLMRIVDETYQRTAGPNVPKLKRYEAFSSTVYGELMPSLSYDIIQLSKLNEGSLFLDLGSGVGNVVAQASLQTGCRSYGIELMPHPARVAREMKEQMEIRCRMWGIRLGEIELEEGDMLQSKRLTELIPQADVVLVDNKVFEESLNEAIRPMFLDLKEGAIVVSLKPFASAANVRLTQRNIDDISSIFHVEERQYRSGSVSWGNNGGTYYIHRVDRTGYAEIRRKFESTHGTRTRSRR